MRPRKQVLLYCADAAAGEQLRLVLEVRCVNPGVRVTTASSLAQFVAVAKATVERFDCLIVYRTRLGEEAQVGTRIGVDRQVCELVTAMKSGGFVLELMNGLPPREYSCASRLISEKLPAAMADVVAAVGIAVAGKRGPRKNDDVRRGFSLVRSEIGMVA